MDFLFLEQFGAPIWLWLAFAGLLASLLAFDLGVLHKRDHEIGISESLALSALYIGLALAFGGVVWWRLGSAMGLAYLTGYIVEKTLSLDNIFVIAMIFLSFSVPRAYQHRVLFWGIIVAIALRGVMIGFGAALISNFGWTLYVFSAVLIVTGVKTLVYPSKRTAGADNALIRFMRSTFNVADRHYGNHFFVRLPHPVTKKPTLFVTPLFLALVSIEVADLVFAVDSVPAIFAITTDPFVVYTSNIFAILGLRALFFALSAVIERFRYLEPTLAIVLIFIGSKIFVADLVGEEPPPWLSLAGAASIIAAGGLYSLWRSQPAAKRWVPRMAALGAVAVLIFGIGSFDRPRRQDAAVRYVSEPVGRGPVIRAVSATGAIERAPPARIDAAVAGRIVALSCESGARVRAGQICATIDPRPYRRRIERERIALAAAEARLEASEARVERRSASVQRNPRADERARAAATRDAAEVARRRAALSAAQARLAATEIVAPMDGSIVSRNVEIGQRVGTPNEAPLFLIAPDAATMTVDARPQDVAEIELGDKASFAVEALPGRLFDGEVSRIRRPPRIGDDAKDDALVSAPDPDRRLADGMTAMVVIVVGQRDDVMRVSNRAIDYAAAKPPADDRGPATPAGWTRLWVLRDGKPAAVSIRLGLDDGVYTEVVEGDLRLGDRLILGESDGSAQASRLERRADRQGGRS